MIDVLKVVVFKLVFKLVVKVVFKFKLVFKLKLIFWFCVVIDLGYGGIDFGMVSKYLCEKDVMLVVGLCVSELLCGKGVDVVMICMSDWFLSDNKWVDFDVWFNLVWVGMVSVYISIYVNVGSLGLWGVEIYYFG